MKLTDRRSIVYVTAAAAFVALLVIARPVISPTTVPVQQASNGSVATAPPPAVPVVDLDLDRLHTAGGQLRESQRDPFRFRPKAPPPAPPIQARPPILQPPVPSGPPPPQPIPLKYFGVYTVTAPDGRKEQRAAFSDARGNTFTGKVGDVLEGRYRLLRIGPDSVDLAYLDGRGQQSIRMTGQ
jgi:hypothetical protein